MPTSTGFVASSIDTCEENLTGEIRALLAGGVAGPVGNVPPELWNADRLTRLLGEIDTAIAAAQYDRAVGLADLSRGILRGLLQGKGPGPTCAERDHRAVTVD
jgi:hypothetical protein